MVITVAHYWRRFHQVARFGNCTTASHVQAGFPRALVGDFEQCALVVVFVFIHGFAQIPDITGVVLRVPRVVVFGNNAIQEFAVAYHARFDAVHRTCIVQYLCKDGDQAVHSLDGVEALSARYVREVSVGDLRRLSEDCSLEVGHGAGSSGGGGRGRTAVRTGLHHQSHKTKQHRCCRPSPDVPLDLGSGVKCFHNLRGHWITPASVNGPMAGCHQ